MLKYKNLFTPINLGKQHFRSRIFASPQDYPGLTSENLLTKEAVAFYEAKAIGGFASVCLGDFMVDSATGHSHPFQLRGDDIRGKVNLTRAANAITRNGAVASVELNHAGVNAMPLPEGFVYGIMDGVREDGVAVRAMDEQCIERIIEKYAKSAALARQCGFNMITIHGGHGWLISQFMSPRDNKRTDAWGGSFEKRMRFPLAVVDAVRKAVGPDFPIEMRISGAEFLADGGYDLDYGIEIAKALDGKVDLIHVSAGHHENDSASMATHPSMFMPDGANVNLAAEIKKHVSTPVATVGGLNDPAMMEEIIYSGKADVVQLGRQSLADPDLPIKALNGREDEINKCIRCNNCFSYSTLGGVFYCSVNPTVGNEIEAAVPTIPRKQKTVLVAGGGIAGMQAALTAARLGHKVILCEKTDRLGGVLLCEEKVPFKKHLMEYIDLQKRLVMREKIDIRLGTQVTPQMAAHVAPDVVISALGSRPSVPMIPGIDLDHIFSAEEIYARPGLTGRRTVILGGGLVGLELAIFLAGRGVKVDVIEKSDRTVASEDDKHTSERMSGGNGWVVGDPIVHGIAIRERLKELPNIKVHLSTEAVRITPRSAHVVGPEGSYAIETDSVIFAVGQEPRKEESSMLAGLAPEFHAIGDCVVPRNIYNATQSAWAIAKNLGRV